jgi:hypothetical protein
MAELTLIVTRGGETKSHPVPMDRPITVGRGQDMDVLVADISVSRHQFTLRRDPHGGMEIELEVSPQSRNQVLLNGHPVTRCKVRPGDRLSVGYCHFALHAEAELPEARAAVVPADPAGPIDLALAKDDEEAQRIAPRWRASVEDQASEQKRKQEQAAAQAGKPKSLIERMALPAAVMVLGVLLVMVYQQNRAPQIMDAPERLDLFADPPPLDCVEAEECFVRAKRAYELGVKLSEQSGADASTIYRAARQFQIATLALRGQTQRLPELQPRYEAARRRVVTLFEDARLRLIRAQQEGNPAAALSAIDEQLAMLQESKHSYRDQLLRARVRVREVKEQARRDALLGGNR